MMTFPSFHKKSRRYSKLGLAPGTVKYIGDRKDGRQIVSLVEFDKDHCNSMVLDTNMAVESFFLKESESQWLNIVGLTNETFIRTFGNSLNLNLLTLESVVDTHQRPKIDDFDHYLFGVFKMVYFDDHASLKYEHLAMVLLEGKLITFQEEEEDVFNGVRTRLSQEASRIRQRGADYLFFALLDAVVDHYFIALEQLGLRLDQLEDMVYHNSEASQGQEIQKLKKEILKLRQHIYPSKDLVQKLLHSSHPLITEETKVFLRDLSDQSAEINETLQLYREMSTNLMELHMSTMGNKMNEVMKVLTIMASIFIPLTFIAGIYGMNFDHMPELHWKFGYPMVWILMGSCLIGMLLYFKKKKWM